MAVTRQDNGSIEIKITLPWSQVKAAYQHQVDTAFSQTSLAGFRKGKAPRRLVESQLDKSTLMSQALSELLPQAYSEIIQKESFKPVLYPKIQIDSGKEGDDWQFTAVTCESPAVTLPPNYQSQIKLLKVAGSDKKIGQVIDFLRQNSQVKIPDLLVEEEANHRLASLAENLTQLGLSLEKYLDTKKISAASLKAETAKSARSDLEIEFLLNHIQNLEHLPDRQKTLQFLQSLV